MRFRASDNQAEDNDDGTAASGIQVNLIAHKVSKRETGGDAEHGGVTQDQQAAQGDE